MNIKYTYIESTSASSRFRIYAGSGRSGARWPSRLWFPAPLSPVA